MKYLMLIMTCLIISSVQAQEMKKASVVRKKAVHHHSRHHHRSHKMANQTHYFPKSQHAKEMGKSVDDNTKGVMGRDQVKMNEKGQKRNMNANTGVALPPNSGNGR